jgi:probable HAF family extracellular repeat protein
MKRIKVISLRIQSAAILAIIGTLAASDRASAQTPMYHLTDLGSINTNPQTGQTISHAAGINSAGQVTGHSYSGSSIHAARFTNGLVEDLGAIPGGDRSYGLGINDSGQVVGDSQYDAVNGCCRHAALFSNGTVTDLGFLPGWGNYSRAHGINQAGEVVGYSGPNNPTASPSPTRTRAFIWDATNGMRDLGTLGGGYSKALSINNSSQVTGKAGTPSGGDHAFIWDAAGGMRDIGTIAGDFSVGNSINANGHVVGKSSINTFDNRDHAFLYDGATMHDLGSLGTGHFFSDRSVAYGINIHDHVVGGTYRLYTGGALYGIPFIYRDGQMYDLSTLVDASGTDYQLGYATGINDAGQIAIDQSIKRSTGEIRAVLLTPLGSFTPTPTPPPMTPTPTPTPCGPPTNFANATSISIPAAGSQGMGGPYPSNIVVAGLAGNVARVTVKLNNFNHAFPDDVDILLVGPGGQNAIILSDVGGAPDAVSVILTLDDAALDNLPDASVLTSGTFKPTNFTGTGTETFSAPAPAPSGGSALSVFNSTNPNGTWSLYVMDDQSTDAGGLAGGWELNITTDTCGSSTPTPAPTATPAATPTPASTPVPTPTPPGASPTPTSTPGATPTPTSTQGATATPSAIPSTTPGGTPTPTTTPIFTPTPSPIPATQALNLSTRMRVQTGDRVGIAGFIIAGTAPKRVLVRVLGPSLSKFAVPNPLADPVLELHGPGSFSTITNDNWRQTQETEIQATGLPPTHNLESAIVATLTPGSYTAVASGANNTSGVGLVEVYDLNQGVASRLANLSTRAFVSTGGNLVIAGFVLGGASNNDRIVVRGLGPSLTAVGVANALADPTLELRDSNGALLLANNNWQDNPTQAAELNAAGLAPTNQLESGIAATLPPGAYTALLLGLNDSAGIGLVEVYDRGAP